MPTTQLLTRTQFENNFLKHFGRDVIHVPITKTYSNISDQETLTEGTGIVVNAVFHRRNTTWTFDKAMNVEGGDAYLISKITDDAGKEDLILADGTKIDVSSIDGDATTISVTTANDHELAVTDEIYITTTINYNGTYTIATVPTSTTFTIADTNHDYDAETVGYMFRDYQKFRIKDSIRRYGVYGSDENPTYDFGNLFFANVGVG